MIIRENYEKEHIRELQEKSHRDPQLIERALYALGLLEALVQTGMKFVFKGGSCLMLLLPHLMRLSTDIDIVVEPGTDVNDYISKAAVIFPFTSYEEQIRIGKNNIEKRHFKFTYFSPVREKNFFILLDILYEKNHYAMLTQREIKNNLLLTEGRNLMVWVPSVDCILGDKFTAFAPHTTGIPLYVRKDLEVMKQFYDIGTLIDEHRNFNHVLTTYKCVVASEISYRGLDITDKDVLEDTIAAAVVIGTKGKIVNDDYPAYVEGIRGVGTHIFANRFSVETASYRAANIIYMAACLMSEQPYEKIDSFYEYADEQLTQSDLKVLSKMRKAQPLQYAYLVKADRLLKEHR
jgi:predicted nucleotidyltransferase component of viral defense system